MPRSQKPSKRMLREEEENTKPPPIPFQDDRVVYQAGKPQVWVRLRPLPNSDDSVFEVSEDGKALKLNVQTATNRVPQRDSPNKIQTLTNQSLDFKADGVLSNSSQEETYLRTVHDVVEKAMNGVSGVIVGLGPELSGKNFTMFGTRGKFQHRGIVPRALESIFSYIEAKNLEMSYGVRIGVIEIRGDKIRDLITLCPYDLKTIGDEGPNGMLLQQIGCVEHGLVLLIRALAGQRFISGPSYSHCHTVVYLDIEGHTLNECQPRIIKSRITFSRIASIPKRSKDVIDSVRMGMANQAPYQVQPDGCAYFCGPNTKPVRQRDPSPVTILDIDAASKTNKSVSVDISIRRDLSFLEQMFIRVNELKKLHRKYAKLKRHGAEMLMKAPRTSPSQTYRQNKLSHCLQDIISGNSEVRIILLVRPERQYLTTTLEALRFAERAKYIPTDIKQSEIPSPEELLKQQKCIQEKEELERQQQAELARKAKEEQEAAAELAAKLAQASLAQMSANSENPKDTPRKSSKAGSSGQDASEKDRRRRKTLTLSDRSDMDLQGGRGKKTKKDRDRDRAARKNRRKNTGDEVIDMGKTPETDSGIPSGSEKKISFAGSDSGQTQESLLTADTGSPRNSNATESQQIPETVAEVPINAKITAVNFGEGNTVTFDWNVDGEGADPGQSALKTEPPSIPEAWSEFVKTPGGMLMNQDVEQKHKVLREMTTEHNDVLQKATMLLTVLNQQQSDLDIAQQIRHLKGDEYDAAGNVILTLEEREMFRKIQELQVGRDDILDKLRTLKTQLYTQKQIVDTGKTECETAFQAFCVEKYAMVFGNVDDATLDSTDQNKDQLNSSNTGINSKCNMKSLQGQNELDAMKHYEDLKRIAEEQARQFLRFYYQRPPWNNFATLKNK